MARNQSQILGQQAGVPLAVLPPATWFLEWLPREKRHRPKDFFVHVAEFLPLTAGGTLSDDFTNGEEAEFLIVAASRIVTAVDNTTQVTFAPFLVTITSGSSGRSLMEQAVHIENLFGTAQQPFFWPAPKFIPRSFSVKTTLQNLDLATARNVRLAYLGFRVF